MNRKAITLLTFIPVIIGIVMFVIGSVAGIYAMSIAGIAVLFGGSFLVAAICTVVVLVKAFRGKNTESNGDSSETDVYGSGETDRHGDLDGNSAAEIENGGRGGEDELDVTQSAETYNSDGSARAEDPFAEYNVPAEEERSERTREDEQNRIEEINSSYGYENRANYAEWQILNMREARKSHNKKSAKFGLLFFAVLLFCIIGGSVFCILGLNLRIFPLAVVGFVLIGSFALIIIAALIVISSLQRISMRGSNFDKDTPHKGVVTACTVSSSTSTGNRRHTRITSVVYRVTIDCDGVEKVAYSRDFYEKGDEVTVYFHNKFKNMAQIDDR